MIVHCILTLIEPTIDGQRWDKLVIPWDNGTVHGPDLQVPIQWAVTRDFALSILPGLTDLTDAHIEVVVQ